MASLWLVLLYVAPLWARDGDLMRKSIVVSPAGVSRSHFDERRSTSKDESAESMDASGYRSISLMRKSVVVSPTGVSHSGHFDERGRQDVEAVASGTMMRSSTQNRPVQATAANALIRQGRRRLQRRGQEGADASRVTVVVAETTASPATGGGVVTSTTAALGLMVVNTTTVADGSTSEDGDGATSVDVLFLLLAFVAAVTVFVLLVLPRLPENVSQLLPRRDSVRTSFGSFTRRATDRQTIDTGPSTTGDAAVGFPKDGNDSPKNLRISRKKPDNPTCITADHLSPNPSVKKRIGVDISEAQKQTVTDERDRGRAAGECEDRQRNRSPESTRDLRQPSRSNSAQPRGRAAVDPAETAARPPLRSNSCRSHSASPRWRPAAHSPGRATGSVALHGGEDIASARSATPRGRSAALLQEQTG